MPTTPTFETLLYKTDPPVATITLNRPEHLNTIVPPMPDEIETAIGLAERDPAIKVIVLRGAGRSFSGGYDFGGGFTHWGDAMKTDGRWDPGKDFAMTSGARNQPDSEVHGDLAGLQTRDRPGPRLVRRRRKRLRAVRGHRHRQRRRRHRHAVRPDVGRLPDRHVVVPAEFGEGEMALADRRAADRKGSRRSRTHQRVGALRTLEARVAEVAAMLAPNSVVAVAGSEADRQPGLREHGPVVDPDPRRHPRRVDAQHTGRTSFIETAASRRGAGRDRTAATDRGATTARPRRSDGPTRRTSSSPRGRHAGRAGRRGRRSRATCR